MQPSANGYGRLSTTPRGIRWADHERGNGAIARLSSVSARSDTGHCASGVGEPQHDGQVGASIRPPLFLPERATFTVEKRSYSSCQNVIR
jgi:hypothetical protein